MKRNFCRYELQSNFKAAVVKEKQPAARKDDLGERRLSPDGYLLGTYRSATAPEPDSSRLMSIE
jgi:hypothetical protein